MSSAKKVGILIFEDVELLDFAGPYEVFSIAGTLGRGLLARPLTIADRAPVRTSNGLIVQPDYLLDEAPHFDILLIPGGNGTRRELHNEATLDWIRSAAEEAEFLLSVCTGSLLIAKAGLAKNKRLTTHASAFDELRAIATESQIIEGARVVDNGDLIVSAGISAGIDMAFYFLQREFGHPLATDVALQMEYDWKPHGLAG
ncbi:DJ-1/PfpI family protein [Sulfidibacter corallicola]|uniref:DJ-1/PfpI family protein n=1 Tax=Sulfidibacter corallicola TaxID=2818388 RepID=A0A8A4TRY2_SULCO|nr:DJ-1/PfpI family protein [Sulfidibacter corallicola]QTD52716.1 DJ-1/PfpI family protein [Sulfidibacter corallicola]